MTALGVKQLVSVTAGHRIASEVHLETSTGLLVGRTQTWSSVLWTNARSAAQTLVFDAVGTVLMAGPLYPYDVGRTPLGQHERTDVWARQMAPDISLRASKVAIVQTWNPSWLAGLSSYLPSLEALASLLADSRMGDLAVGEKMRWPDDELPWATWPRGLCVLRAGFDPTVPIERESHHDIEDVESAAELGAERRL
jgi:hypothetical protein